MHTDGIVCTVNNQLALAMCSEQHATFENFYPGDNAELLNALYQFMQDQESQLWLWGAPLSGKTHLMLAARAYALEELCIPVAYQDCADVFSWAGFDRHLAWVILDNVDKLAGHKEHEHELFARYNAWRAQGVKMIFSGSSSPKHTDFQLQDLQSRLAWGAVFRLHALDDQQKQLALQYIAKIRGLELSASASAYLLRHFDRNMNKLMATLSQLDAASLQEQRKLTVPFIKQVLSSTTL